MSKDSKFFEVTGHLYKVFPVQAFPSGFQKRTFVLETRDTGRDGVEYKNFVQFEVTKEWLAELDNIGIASKVTVNFSLGGKEWKPADATEPKYINYLRCWKINVLENTNQDGKTVKEPEVEFSDVDDSLPF